jgi:hypothetical protein
MYQVIGTDRFEYGPIEATQIHQWIREGRVSEQTLVKAPGSNQWQLLREIPDFAAAFMARPKPPAPVPSSAPARAAASVQVPTYLLPAVLCTILWCALAIPGIYFGVQVNNKLGKGDVTGAEAASRKAKLWCIIALIIGLVVNAFLGWLTLAMYKFYQGSMP